MVAEVEVLEFNNKINKEVKMFLVVLSSDIKASWNWCQKPQALKNAGIESWFIFQTELKVGIWILYYFSDIFPT